MAASSSVDPAAVAAAASEMNAQFEEIAVKMRQYLDQNVGRNLQEVMKELAENRPAEPKLLMGQVFTGKKTVGEIKTSSKSQNKEERSAAPRSFLNNSVVTDLPPMLVQLYANGSRRPVSDLGDMVLKHEGK
eukprot:gb/GFBE01062236.1/.p1 GENE.gb/GFBE01062236.1/~~gb/GFBE01062236.1/.p1  ORF type:complete len:132 (+),score=23.34 gb/GFBE01062236.1/:1-396(+)